MDSINQSGEQRQHMSVSGIADDNLDTFVLRFKCPSFMDVVTNLRNSLTTSSIYDISGTGHSPVQENKNEESSRTK